jgi:hypothetical protein
MRFSWQCVTQLCEKKIRLSNKMCDCHLLLVLKLNHFFVCLYKNIVFNAADYNFNYSSTKRFVLNVLYYSCHKFNFHCLYLSNYGLDNQAIEVRSPAEVKWINHLASVSRPALGSTQPPVQCVPGVHSLGLKCGRGVTLTTHPHLVSRSRMNRSYISSPPPQAPPWRVVGLL